MSLRDLTCLCAFQTSDLELTEDVMEKKVAELEEATQRELQLLCAAEEELLRKSFLEEEREEGASQVSFAERHLASHAVELMERQERIAKGKKAERLLARRYMQILRTDFLSPRIPLSHYLNVHLSPSHLCLFINLNISDYLSTYLPSTIYLHVCKHVCM